MLSLLIGLLILILILGVVYWIITMIPIPPQFRWIVQVLFAIIVLIAIVSLLTGAWTFPVGGHPVLR